MANLKFILPALSLAFGGCHFVDRHVISNPGQNETICVESGDRYYFDLEENGTTGYTWEYKCDDPDVEVELVHKPPEMRREGEMICGAPGKASVSIRIHRGFDGPSTVTFGYRRPWEKEPIKSFTLAFYKRTGASIWK